MTTICHNQNLGTYLSFLIRSAIFFFLYFFLYFSRNQHLNSYLAFLEIYDMILNIILLYDKVGCLLDILGQEKCFQCLQKEKSAQSLNRASAQRSLLGREKTNIQHFFSSLPGWTCSVSVSQRCLYHLCARSEDIQFLGWGTTSTPPKGLGSLSSTSITRSFAGRVLFFWQRIELVKDKDMA